MQTEMVDWIDEAGRAIASLPRHRVRRRNLLHRVSATLIFHPGGKVLVHQRTMGKDVYPGLYDLFVGGTVVSGESPQENALREIGEEMGVTGVAVHQLFIHRFRDRHVDNLTTVFACLYDGPLRFQEQEVAGGGWAGGTEITAHIAAGRICPDSLQGWRLYQSLARNAISRDGHGLPPWAVREALWNA